MSMLRHRFSNERGGGGGALNHLPLLFCKSVYYNILVQCISQFQALPSSQTTPGKIFKNRQILAPWQFFVSNPRRLGFPGTLNLVNLTLFRSIRDLNH